MGCTVTFTWRNTSGNDLDVNNLLLLPPAKIVTLVFSYFSFFYVKITILWFNSHSMNPQATIHLIISWIYHCTTTRNEWMSEGMKAQGRKQSRWRAGVILVQVLKASLITLITNHFVPSNSETTWHLCQEKWK
jgi:Na+/H+ antiporter NhaC